MKTKPPKTITLIIFLLIITIAFSSCDKGTEPETIKPGRRDYTWTVDTLNAFWQNFDHLWGSSPTDVWAIGMGGELKDDLWHYDGEKWEPDNIPKFSAWTIYGFSKNDVWLAGQNGDIWHYDGKTWNVSISYNEELGFKYYDIIFLDIWGDRPNNIYAVGLADSVINETPRELTHFGIIMHYNGKKWKRIEIGHYKSFFMRIKKNRGSNKYLIMNLIQNVGITDSVKFFEFDGKHLKEVYAASNLFVHDLTTINGEMIMCTEGKMYNYRNGKFHEILSNPLPNSWSGVFGRNRKDIIWMMQDGLTHYNGTDFEYILHTNNKSWSDIMVFDKEIFALANDFYSSKANNIVYHGVLK